MQSVDVGLSCLRCFFLTCRAYWYPLIHQAKLHCLSSLQTFLTPECIARTIPLLRHTFATCIYFASSWTLRDKKNLISGGSCTGMQLHTHMHNTWEHRPSSSNARLLKKIRHRWTSEKVSHTQEEGEHKEAAIFISGPSPLPVVLKEWGVAFPHSSVSRRKKTFWSRYNSNTALIEFSYLVNLQKWNAALEQPKNELLLLELISEVFCS